MKAEQLNRMVRAELALLVEQTLLAPDQVQRIRERYPVGRWDLVALTRWFSILGAVTMGIGLVLLARHLGKLQTLVEVGLLLACILCVALGVWAERRRNLPRTGAALELLGAIAFQGFSFALAIHYSSGSGNWPAVVGIDCVVFLAMAYALRNRLVLVYATVNLFVWFGGRTGYVSGWGMYWLGMTYPLRFLVAGSAVLGLAYVHFKLAPQRYRSFSRVYVHFGLLVVHLALWFLALFGYFESEVHWYGTEGQRLAFSALWAGVSIGCIFASVPTGLRLLRGYGLTFLILNLYTFYFQFVFANRSELWWLHLLLVGGSMVGVGVWFERRLRSKRGRGGPVDPDDG